MLVFAISLPLNRDTAGQAPDSIPCRIITTSGEGFSAEVENQAIRFRNLDEAGQTSERQLRLSELSWLRFVSQPEDSSVGNVTDLIAKLGSSAWPEREAAEDELRKMLQQPEVVEQLQRAASHPLLEVRYRAGRVLGSKSASAALAARRWDYDTARLADGSEINGNAGPLTIRGERGGKPLALDRSKIVAILALAPPPLPQLDRTAGIRLNHQFRNSPTTNAFDFETGVGGRKLVQGAVLDREFLGEGLLLDASFNADASASGPGVILVSNYSLNFENKPVGGNSICVSRNVEALQTRFKGITGIRFCAPWEVHAPAGVNCIGLFAARNDGPLAFVMQCFSEDGHLLAEVEANEERCAWFEALSGEPVARVSFRANPYALQLNQTLDEDYAIDNLALSPPVPVLPSEPGERGLVRWKNGDLAAVTEIVPGDGEIAIRDPASGTARTVPLADLDWWAAPRGTAQDKTADDPGWRVMLADRSVVNVRWQGDGLVRERDGQPVTEGKFAALWSQRVPLRFPVSGDHQFGPTVAVFPGSRLAADDFRLSATGIAWRATEVTRLLQPVMISKIGNVPEDPTGENLAADPLPLPTFESVGWDETEGWRLPSLWFQAPPPCPEQRPGSVSLRNGEKYSFGPGASFTLQSSNGVGLVLTDEAGHTLEFTWDEIWRMVNPAPDR